MITREQLLAARKHGLSRRQLAEELGTEYYTVARACIKHKVCLRDKPGIKTNTRRHIKRLLSCGEMNQSEIARYVGVTRQRVSAIATEKKRNEVNDD